MQKSRHPLLPSQRQDWLPVAPSNQDSAIAHSPSQLPFPLHRGSAFPSCQGTSPSPPRNPPGRDPVYQVGYPMYPGRPPRQFCVSDRLHPTTPTKLLKPPSSLSARCLVAGEGHATHRRSSDHNSHEEPAVPVTACSPCRRTNSQAKVGPKGMEKVAPERKGRGIQEPEQHSEKERKIH